MTIGNYVLTVNWSLPIRIMICEKNIRLEKESLPLVSILLAVYNPNKSWFIEQLISLNEQTYKNIELLVYDDCPEYPVDEHMISKYINKFPCKIMRGTKNRGSNKAFEELTKSANGDFLVYCDQDDVWEIKKIEILMETIKRENSVLAYSDMSVIDAEGEMVAETLIEKKPRIQYVYGENLFRKFFFKNCVSGCCMLVKGEIAKKAIPFSIVTVHDQWICIVSTFYGKISFVDETLVKYRMHGENQTGSLKGIYSKEDYYNLRIKTLETRVKEVKNAINFIERDKNLKEIEEFCFARINKDLLKIFKYRYLSKKEAYFEILIKYLPNCIFKLIVNKLKI